MRYIIQSEGVLTRRTLGGSQLVINQEVKLLPSQVRDKPNHDLRVG
ncbi:hypothetical protein [Phenylobacterium sp.]|nr:hypothetical protein [Phenylobacterium sp.]